MKANNTCVCMNNAVLRIAILVVVLIPCLFQFYRLHVSTTLTISFANEQSKLVDDTQVLNRQQQYSTKIEFPIEIHHPYPILNTSTLCNYRHARY